MNESSNYPAGQRTSISEAVTTALRQTSFLRVMVVLAATVVVLVGIRLGAPILNPILFAVVMTLLFSPVYSWLLRRGVRERRNPIFEAIKGAYQRGLDRALAHPWATIVGSAAGFVASLLFIPLFQIAQQLPFRGDALSLVVIFVPVAILNVRAAADLGHASCAA